MVDTATRATPASTDRQHALVDAAITDLLSAHDPRQLDDLTFRGARYDAGLAWVHFPVGSAAWVCVLI